MSITLLCKSILDDVTSSPAFDFGRYWEGENKLIRPNLEKSGFSNIRFYDGERDSFGVLSRRVVVDFEGVKNICVFYG